MDGQHGIVRTLTVAALLIVAGPALAGDDNSSSDESSSAASADKSMKVIDAKAGDGVEDREPTGVSDTFKTGDKVTVWMAVQNPESTSNLEVVWKRDGSEVHTYDLEVGKSWKWRTWARLKITSAGDWSVEIRDTDGNSLKTVEFTVEG